MWKCQEVDIEMPISRNIFIKSHGAKNNFPSLIMTFSFFTLMLFYTSLTVFLLFQKKHSLKRELNECNVLYGMDTRGSGVVSVFSIKLFLRFQLLFRENLATLRIIYDRVIHDRARLPFGSSSSKSRETVGTSRQRR